ncbi:AAA domain-containing protein [Ditylenchus destructor]|uniref:AAA domain-containing protein n=1 Tax=Ditylenchus destructor TaxID=166010 RepID=A0AAD4MZL5_9BILA|nr:AAA domain-containing protein [Ditylenchus destructor]
MRKNQFGRIWCKIVLTGGPCAGKTTAQKLIVDRIKAEYAGKWRVFTVAEAATFLYQGRIQRSTMDDARIQQWQEDILRTIIQLENVYEHIAETEVFNTLIICDRGGLDPKIFTASDNHWNAILQKVGITEDDILNRYDWVILLSSAPREIYEQAGNNECRRENHEEALRIDAKYGDLWKGHKQLLKVRNRKFTNDPQNDWTIKFDDVFDIIQTILDVK